jgi:bifunctional UDP-N-acetylglucosamine pyrophosphorylase/glucosamine-1-phosphate N-acetyltransferase
MSSGMSQKNNRTNEQELGAIILAAGKGTRMNSDLPKVLHPVADRPIVSWVIDACRAAGCNKIAVVVGFGAEDVKQAVAADDVVFSVQDQQLGTGHATLCAHEHFKDGEGDVLVLAGDGPLIRAETIERMIQQHRATDAAATLATSVIPDPTTYGRIVRNSSGGFEAIVEEKNCTDEQKKIHEVYPSYACFDGQTLFRLLSELRPDGVSGEYYVTTLPMRLNELGQHVELVDGVPPEDVLSINTPEHLAEVDAILRNRLSKQARTQTEEITQ